MGIRPCNRCAFERIVREAQDKPVERVPRPLGKYFTSGEDVLVDGVWKVWFAEIPERCEC
jgi:hypothetical protein